LTEFKQY